MTTKRKPGIRGSKVIHECSQTDNLARHGEILERTNKILYGNGTPKDGLVFRFDKFMNDHERVLSVITEIKETVKLAISESANTQKLLEKYKSDEEQFEKGKNAIIQLEEIKNKNIRDNKRENRKLFIQVVSVMIALFMAYLGFKRLNDGQQAIKEDTRVTNEVLIPPGQSTRGLKTIVIDNDTTSTVK